MMLFLKKLINNRFLQHLAFWAFYVLCYHFNYRKNEPAYIGLLVTISCLPFHLFFTYSQLYFLIPKFLLKKKLFAYGVLTFLFAKIATNISWLNYVFFMTPLRTGHRKDVIYWDSLWTINTSHASAYFSIFMIAGLAISIKLLKKWYKENEQKQEMQKQKLSIELEILKSQVHPHFLFNTLNNLYSLTLVQSEKASTVVANLSDLLRYMLYECNSAEVSLDKEIKIIKKYVELEKLRYGDRIDVSMSTNGNTDQLLIAPLLLIPFVENSFKHGLSDQLEQCWVNLYFHLDGNVLFFNLSNSSKKDDVSKHDGGIGLKNIQKRLDLIYKDRYDLQLIEEDEIFTVRLKIDLNRDEKLQMRKEPLPIRKTAAL